MKKVLCLVLISMLCFSFFACEGNVEIPNAENDVKVLFINVGRADAMLVCVDGKNYMIDTGEKQTAYKLLAAMNSLGVESLDGLILTHTHSDHIGGAKTLSKYVEIDRLYCASISENKKNGENEIDNIALKCALEQVKLDAGDRIDIKDGIYFEVLAPIVYNADDDNDNSLVLRLRVNKSTVLFTGDMQFAEEQTLMNRTSNLKADVLKVGNHGNKDATSEQFALAVSPEYAIISTDTAVDENSANKRVRSALSMAEIFITCDYDMGILMTLKKDGGTEFENLTDKDGASGLEICSVDLEKQTLIIKNNSAEGISLSDYMVYSENGDELYVFPEGAYIEADSEISLACEGNSGNYTWMGEDKAWNKKKGDIAILYTPLGKEVSRLTVPPLA